ncbi:DHA2 family efflux MFS transporter permease subunit [Brevibacillus daliensis]|uniref:DHA2 family efflux MFS transporter permease subunit n=1 Tax=Brevibacillus daliensis TaxID=2892995 RepID=UPI001E64DDDB|nr:DHA2 family efflux MFS transporter permease subunit [Brevibacillus daliensis]
MSASNNTESASYKWLALLAIVMGTFVAVLNNSIINIALPKLVTVFGSTTETIQWVLTGYMLSSAVVIPMSGTLSDIFGTKRLFILSLAVFTVISTFCGFAWSDSSMIFFRIIQGLSGGFIMPVGMSIIYMIMPREQIGMALGLWGIAAMVAPAVGPTLSGYIIEYLNWRFLFFMGIPVGVLAVVMGSIILKETPIKKVKFDFLGAILSIIGFASLLLALTKGASEGWTSLYVVSLIFISIFSLILLVYVELTIEQPLIDFRILKNGTYSLSLLIVSFITMGMFGGIFMMPLYMQNIQGLSAMQTGILLMPQSIAMAVMMPIGGKLFDKFGVVPLGIIGLTLAGITSYELQHLAQDTPHRWIDTILTIRGVGMGMCMTPLSTVGMNAIPRHLVSQASSLSNLIRSVMGSFAIAILTALMTNRQNFHAVRISENVPSTSDVANQVLAALSGVYTQSGIDATSSVIGASSILGGMIQKEALTRGIADTFFISAFPILLSIPLVLFFLKKKKASIELKPTPSASDNKPMDVTMKATPTPNVPAPVKG